MELPERYRSWINELDSDEDLTGLRISVSKSGPFGTVKWTKQIIKHFGLELTMRERGRPKKGT